MAEFKLGRIRFVWKNNWVTSTTYYIDDVILVNGKTYICIKGHTSLSDFNLDLNNSKWQLMSDGQMWRNNWLTTTQYQLNDLVKYGATIYICTQGHMSQALLESDQGKWDIFASGSFEWKTDWAINTVYKVADLVKYGAGLYRCVEGHTSAASLALGLEDSNSKWDVVSIGFEYKTDWAGSTRYKINDVVKKGGGLWLSLIGHTSDAADFTADSSSWSQFVEGLEFEDSYNVATAYQAGDIVNYGGYQYVAITNHTGTVPTTGSQTDWDLFSTGFSHQGEYNNATAYKVGHVVRVGGFTYVATADTTGNRPPHASWERLNQGQEWQGNWADATLYDLGDIVRHTNSSYVCVSSHTSDQTTLQNRPDQDLDGSEWNQLVGGAETTVLTTEGDIVYYTGSGPSRLPIGSDGQVLKVSGTDLIWDDFGIVNNTFYVAPSGTDSIDYGYTLDKAFKTVRYGLEKIQDGHNSTAAKRLMQRNRAFIQAESVEYVTYNIANPTGIWVGFVNDDIEKCRRDIGQLLDAIIWDLSHGGNERTRLATLTYFLDGALIAAIADENEQLADTVDYMITVVDAVISNLAPAANYQTLNSVATPITQIIDASLIEKTGDQVILNNLGNIISAALIAEVPTNVPVEVKPTSTLFVKTGIFAEVGPMIVPQRTALVGDELRSTKIIPAGVLVAAADVPKSLAAITRLVAVMSDIVTNSAVTISTGNAVTQVTTRPAGSTAAGSAAAALVTDIKEYIDFKINAVGTEPTLAGTNTPNTTTDYTYAVGVIEENRAFLVAEIHAYIAVTYPGYNYNIASCSRDVNSYIDAVLYDLIYTGNYKSLLAATYYVNAVGGSLLQDMFYVRDGSGIRNCTLNGLTGTLGADNAYGTKRPTAGAFVSLDPGYGPADTNVWISSRSPYIQNVSTFGTACIGLKVDGALHAGGNDSIVANDFTQVLSDGIGYWVTNLGRSELVSVFTYYNHIGYLAEAGGKIRAANGNNSYGTFGSVAEGVDSTETAIAGTVNNYAFEAQIGRVFTDNNQILSLEYNNAGTNYTTENNAYTFTGIGYDQVIVGDEIRDNAVFETRMLTVGTDYRSSSNTAQTGTVNSITLAGSETAPSVAYAGMRLYIVAGPGAGQYGYINAYNSGTKLATILRDSDDASGWDHVIPGTVIVAPNATSTYSVEPRITVAVPGAPTYSEGLQVASGTYNTSNVYNSIAYGNNKWVAVSNSSAESVVSNDRGTWVADAVIFAAGGATPSASSKIAYGELSSVHYFVTIPQAAGTDGAYSIDAGATWNAMTLPTSATWADVGFNGTHFMAISQAGNVAISTNGTTWTAATALAALGSGVYTGLTYGMNRWLVVAGGASETQTDVRYSANNGTSWLNGSITGRAWSSVAFGNGKFIAVGDSNSAAYSFDGITWLDRQIHASYATWVDISYGQGQFLVLGTDGATTTAVKSFNGFDWSASTITPTTAFYAAAIGNPGGVPTWLMVGGTTAASTAQFQKNAVPALVRGFVQTGQLAAIRITEPGSGYDSAPTITITDPNNTGDEATFTVRLGDGALAQPSFVNRGVDWESADGFVTGDGYGDIYQNGTTVNVSGLTDIPNEGANVTFAGDDTYYKLVNVTNLLGSGPYTARLQVSPAVTIPDAPEHNVALEVRIRYSQVRLTGHDFLDIGTGNFANSNYPGVPSTEPVPGSETKDSGGGRVFYTSTDQDGNFRVGELFSVEQSTGKSTLNADAFNLAGLQELQLGTIALGGSNTSINEFSTDGTFAANSDSIVPTQKAIRTYIQSQIGGGGSNLNVNSITAGQVLVQLNNISHTSDGTININSRANFTGGISGSPLALNYFLQK
tara:strand:+ start:4925 stop:10420 length:5496 start_codon:yes stop_codon:yes gene_type:complete